MTPVLTVSGVYDLSAIPEDDLFSWIAHRELNQDLPGANVGLIIDFDDSVSFED